MKAIERIYEYLAFKGIKAIPFEKRVGLSNGYLGKQLARNADLGEGIINKIIENCPDLSPLWLITGVGEMINQYEIIEEDPREQYGLVREEHKKIPNKIKLNPIGIPLIPVSAMAGNGNGEFSVNESDVEYRYIIPEFKNKADFLIRVSGNSMAPKYYNGDLVACKKIPTETFIQWGKVYIMDTVQGALCKRLSKSNIDDHVLVVSDNEKYPEFDLPKTEIRNLAIVIGVIRLE